MSEICMFISVIALLLSLFNFFSVIKLNELMDDMLEIVDKQGVYMEHVAAVMEILAKIVK